VQSTVGASFLTSKVHDPESGTTIRLQMWDTAGQERFRSISRLYYRGAHAAILCYDITSKKSFEEMGMWLQELRDNCGGGQGNEPHDMILHVVGTKADVVAADPRAREVPFERCINYVAEQLYPNDAAMSTGTKGDHHAPYATHSTTSSTRPRTQSSAVAAHLRDNHTADQVWDCCHEVSAKTGEGVDEIFRVVVRKLVDQHLARLIYAQSLQPRGRTDERAYDMMTPGLPTSGLASGAATAGSGGVGTGYFDLPTGGSGGGRGAANGSIEHALGNGHNGSFRIGHGDKRRSWLGALGAGMPTPGGMTAYTTDDDFDEQQAAIWQQQQMKNAKGGRCC
jgi:GTPase SAR1 family protein